MSSFEVAQPDPNAGRLPRWLIPTVVLLVIVVGVQQLYFAPKVQKSMMGSAVVEEARAITAAIKRYEVQYGKLPLSAGVKDQVLATEGVILQTLIGADAENNPKKQSFYSPSPAVTLWGGFSKNEHTNEVKLVDPWKNAFVVVLDSDGDGVVKHPDTGEEHRASCIVFSKGEDAESAEDDLGSWMGTFL